MILGLRITETLSPLMLCEWDTKQVSQGWREGTLQAVLLQRHRQHHCLLGITQPSGSSQEQARQFLLSGNWEFNWQTENKQMCDIYSMSVWRKMPATVKSWSGDGFRGRTRGFPEILMVNRLEPEKELTRGRWLSPKEAQVSQTQRPELLPRHKRKAREIGHRKTDEKGEQGRAGRSERDFRQHQHFSLIETVTQ